MADGYGAPVIAGLAIGIAFVVLFASLFNSASPIVQRRFHTDLSIEGLAGRYGVGEVIGFTIHAEGYGRACLYPVFKIIDLDRNGQVILDTADRGPVIICDPDPANINMGWSLSELGIENPLVIDRIGHYKIEATLGNSVAEECFIVDNISKRTIEMTAELGEVKAFTSHYPEAAARVYYVTTCATESCQTLIRVPSTVEYWFEDGDTKQAFLRVSIEQKWDGEPVYFYVSCLVEGSEDARDIHGSQIEQEAIVEFLMQEGRCPDGRTLTWYENEVKAND